MSDHEGYVNLHRQIQDSRVWQSPPMLKVFLWCVMRANFKPGWVSVEIGRGQAEVFLKRAQFIYGRKSAARRLRMPEGSVADRMRKLAEWQNLVIQPDTHWSIVTVVNYDLYNPIGVTDQQAKQQPSNSQPTAKQQQSNTENKDNKDKTDKKEPRAREPDVLFDALAEVFHEGLVPKKSAGRIAAVAHELRARGATPDDIRTRFNNARNTWDGPFGPEALLDKWSQLTRNGGAGTGVSRSQARGTGGKISADERRANARERDCGGSDWLNDLPTIQPGGSKDANS